MQEVLNWDQLNLGQLKVISHFFLHLSFFAGKGDFITQIGLDAPIPVPET
jgi:hypothetical protein